MNRNQQQQKAKVENYSKTNYKQNKQWQCLMHTTMKTKKSTEYSWAAVENKIADRSINESQANQIVRMNNVFLRLYFGTFVSDYSIFPPPPTLFSQESLHMFGFLFIRTIILFYSVYFLVLIHFFLWQQTKQTQRFERKRKECGEKSLNEQNPMKNREQNREGSENLIEENRMEN